MYRSGGVSELGFDRASACKGRTLELRHDVSAVAPGMEISAVFE